MMNSKKSNLWVLMILVGGICCSIHGALAQSDDPLLDETDFVINNSQMDVDGMFDAPKAPGPAEKMQKMRKQLEDKNEQMVQKKIEDIRIQHEQQLSHKLQDALTGRLEEGDEVKHVEAAVEKKQHQEAPPVINIVQAPALEPTKDPVPSVRIVPMFGKTFISGETTTGEQINYESNVDLSLAFEVDVNSRISMGVEISHKGLGITSWGNYGLSNFGHYYYYGPTFNNWYTNTYGAQKRQLNYGHIAVGLAPKIFFSGPDSKVRPYLGGVVAFNRSTLEFENQQLHYYSYNSNQIPFGTEKYATSYISGGAILGALVLFTPNVGLNFEARYIQGLSSGFSQELGLNSWNYDQYQLEQLGKALEDSSFASLSAGLSIGF